MASVLSPELQKQIKALDGLLASLSGELDSAHNPHRQALRHLKVDSLGSTATPYADEAFRIWSDVVRRKPTDAEAVHHLAIMHHARAMDLEAGRRPDASNDDWSKALDYWHGLWERDEFWQPLIDRVFKDERAERRPAINARLREALALDLLRVHFDIAFDEGRLEKRFDRAKHHVKLALESAFPRELKVRARRGAYEAFIRDLPEVVWSSDTLDPAAIKIGTDRIERYLDADPACPQALADLLRLQVRLLRAWWTDLRALGPDQAHERKAILGRLRESGERWRPYLDQLPGELSSIDEVDQADLRQKLGLWYRVMGEVCCSQREHREAIGFYEVGVAATAADEDEHRRCRRARGECHAHMAIEAAREAGQLAAKQRAEERQRASQAAKQGKQDKAAKKAKGVPKGVASARHLCDEVRARDDLSFSALSIVAQAFCFLEDFDKAIAICQAALEHPPEYDIASSEELELHQEGLDRMRGLLDKIREAKVDREVSTLLEQADDLMTEGDFVHAKEKLDRAAALGPDENVFFLRSHCHLRMNRVAEARSDLEAFKGIVKAATPAMHQLEKVVSEEERLLATFGTEANRLRREAENASDAGDHGGAAQMLDRALLVCPARGRNELQEQYASVLSHWAQHEFQTALDDAEADTARKEKAGQSALGRLQRAHQLAPKADRKVAIAQVTELLETLAHKREQEAQRVELLNKYGGEEAFKLQQKAVKAFNAGDVDEAIECMRKALAVVKQRVRPEDKPISLWTEEPPALRAELVMMLVAKISKPMWQTLRDPKTSLDEKERACRDALAQLEAERRQTLFEPLQIRSEIEEVKKLLTKLDEARAAERRERELLGKYGNVRAFEIQQQALQAFNQGNRDAAVGLMRRALAQAPTAPGLIEELSLMLTALAVEKANAATARRDLEAPRRLLREALQLKPDNENAMRNLQAME